MQKRHAVNATTATFCALHDARWLRLDELKHVLALARAINATPITPQSARLHLRTLAGALKNGRVRLTPSAHSWASAIPAVSQRGGARVVDALSAELLALVS